MTSINNNNNNYSFIKNLPINLNIIEEKEYSKKYIILERYLDNKSHSTQFNCLGVPENYDSTNQLYLESNLELKQIKDIETLNSNKENGIIDRLGVYREVYCQDAIEWLKNNEIDPKSSVITSLPDISEVSGFTVEQYKSWFTSTVHLIGTKLSDNNVAIVYQTDIKRHWKNDRKIIEEYIDKGYLAMKGIESSGCKVIWHKIMAANDLTKKIITKNKSSFTHMICFAKNPTNITFQDNTPDINTRGDMIWSRAMGLNACEISTSFIRGIGSNTIIDPFCGKGSILAVSNVYGLNSIGVDLSIAKYRNSLNLQLDSETIKQFTTKVWQNSNNIKNKLKNDQNNQNNQNDQNDQDDQDDQDDQN